MVAPRKQTILRGPTWIIVLVSVACFFLMVLLIHPLLSPTATCKLFPTKACRIYNYDDMRPNDFSRELTDEEIESRVVVKEMLKLHPVMTKTSKVAFLFMSPGSLPFEKLWHMFFQEKPVHVSRYFAGRDIRSEPMVDPGGIANWSVTYVDWSEGKWHPRSFSAQDITYHLMTYLTSIDESPHITSDPQRTVLITPCMWNGSKRPCYLFARKFHPETLDKLMHLFPNSSTS
ncbi:hypothetical protein TanjilG_07915 [Lupinus angustifolius]|uniref:Uncharacterized protein n=1 Tax=Lupinus angustifolius TaxID=3871 RepID=A0A1J7G7T9_LUPAN|nr:hypothetical protein TanjilG_07915 [Lupinus angustifolius]